MISSFLRTALSYHHMKKQFLFAVFGLGLMLGTGRATAQTFINYGVTNHPQIDAQAVVNYGTIEYNLGFTEYMLDGGHIPFETQNTSVLTNQTGAAFTGNIGFRFYNNSPSGRLPMAKFVNRGLIEVIYPFSSGTYLANGDGPLIVDSDLYGYLSGTYVDIRAENISNSGLIEADRMGIIRLDGANIDLTRGGIGSANVGQGGNAIFGPGSVVTSDGATFYFTSNDGTNYSNPESILDVSASVRSNVISTASLPGGQSFRAFARTNALSPTNWFTQVVFVQTNGVDTNIVVDVKFTPPLGLSGFRWFAPDPTTDGYSPIIQLGLVSLDVLTGSLKTNNIFVQDFTAFGGVQTNFTLETNFFLLPRVGTRPTAFETSVTQPPEWRSSVTNNIAYTNSLLSGTNLLLPFVTNLAAYYTFEVGNPTAQGTLEGGSSTGIGIDQPTNWPGSIQIKADQLNLNYARFFADSTIVISASNLVANTNVQIDSPHLYLDLNSTSGLLTVSNLVKSQVNRFSGRVSLNSHFYTNYIPIVDTNMPIDTNVATEVTTNYIEVKTHVFILDHSQLLGVKPIVTDEVYLRANRVICYDNLNVTEKFLVSGTDFRNLGQFSSSDKVDSIGVENFPRLVNFTNDGAWSVPNLDRLGSDRSESLNNVINRGSMSASTHQIRARTFENSGTLRSVNGPISISSDSAKLDDGTITSSAGLDLYFGDLKTRNCRLTAGGINLTLTGTLADGGSNFWNTTAGFQLLAKPTLGDFLGMTLTSTVPVFADVHHTWAGDDVGNTALGYLNNAALGHLVLTLTNFAQFSFSGASGHDALYVDYLEMKNFDTNNLAASLNIADNFRIYYATSNIPVEWLDGQLNGKLRWCSHFAGPYSKYPIVDSQGKTNYYNGALRFSTYYDSDGDGIVNASDTSPFEGPSITSIIVTNQPSLTSLLSWYAITQKVYTVQYSTNLMDVQWKFLSVVSNSAPTNGAIIYKDPLNKTTRQKYYRIFYVP
jgi:hypothetical protein